MDDIYKLLSEGFEVAQQALDENEQKSEQLELSLEAYLSRSKDVLKQKQTINPKPMKRFMRIIPDEDEESPAEIPIIMQEPDKELRPIRTAKSKANLNLKEVPVNSKMRNDNNTVTIKTERSSSVLSKSTSRESLKENSEPEKNQKRRSPDEGIQVESEPSSVRTSKRSDSVELISAKIVEIDITANEERGMMPPPAIPKKAIVRKTRTKQKVQAEEPLANPLRITRSKIKLEKVSLTTAPEVHPEESVVAEPAAVIAPVQLMESTITSKRGKKKYPMPILVKIEPEEERSSSSASAKEVSQKKTSETATVLTGTANDETFNVAPAPNETITIAPALNETVTIPNANSTVTLQKMHDSLMTEDNDDDEMDTEPPKLPKSKPPQLPTLKLKKNEVFNPYLSSPVKQKVQAFEKRALQGTPEKYKTLPPKFGCLKAGTPSKIGVYSKTTPLNSAKSKYIFGGSATSLTASGHKAHKPLKKVNSLSQESLDEAKKAQQSNQISMEEKKKQREEKQRQALLQREILDKEKRDLTLKQQQERDEKFKKLMKEKEEKQRMEILKKKLLKENQAKKYAEEKAKKDEFTTPKPVDPPSASKNDSLHKKLQKQLILDKSYQLQKEESQNLYTFDSLHTDDSTDDESKPSVKRPPPPAWSKKRHRKPLIAMQTHINSNILDTMFSAQPINVDLKEIFPAIDSRKLVRNSSAIWRTPPKHY